MKTNINFDRYEAAQVTITSKSEPYEAGSGNKHGKTLMKVRVIYNEEEQRGLPKNLILKDSVFSLTKVQVGAVYMMKCNNKNGMIEFFEDIDTFQHRSDFVNHGYPAITGAIRILERMAHSSRCITREDYYLIRETVKGLYFSLIALGRQSDLSSDESFYGELPF